MFSARQQVVVHPHCQSLDILLPLKLVNEGATSTPCLLSAVEAVELTVKPEKSGFRE